jgi:hypothetical protein
MAEKDPHFYIDTSAAEAQIAAALEGLGELTRQALGVIILDAEADTRENLCPVGQTGNLSSSIKGTVDEDGQGATLQTSGVDYAAPQEFREDYNHPDLGPQGIRGAHYIYRGMARAGEKAPETVAKMYATIWKKDTQE